MSFGAFNILKEFQRHTFIFPLFQLAFFTQYENPLAVKTFNLHLQLHCHSIYHIQLIINT